MSRHIKKKTSYAKIKKRNHVDYAPNKRSLAQRIEDAFNKKKAVKFDDRLLLAENAYAVIDKMKTNPSQNGFIDLVDITNILTNMIFATDRKHKANKAWKSPDMHIWLWERGHEMVAKTINLFHEKLMNIEQRYVATGSLAMDAVSFDLAEKVITMYQEAISVCPKGLVEWCVEQSRNSHREEDGNFIPVHITLEDTYEIKEQIWNESQIEVDDVEFVEVKHGEEPMETGRALPV